ncbi:hypothetical protein D3C72_1937030 [compost metagenome]
MMPLNPDQLRWVPSSVSSATSTRLPCLAMLWRSAASPHAHSIGWTSSPPEYAPICSHWKSAVSRSISGWRGAISRLTPSFPACSPMRICSSVKAWKVLLMAWARATKPERDAGSTTTSSSS